MLVSRGYYTT